MSRRKRATDRDRLLVDEVDSNATIGIPAEQAQDVFRSKPRIDDDDYLYSNPSVPYGTIAFATLLLIIGSICLATAASIAMGVLDASMDDRLVPLFVLGLLLDIPGIYYASMTMCVLLKLPGWTWARFPQWN